MLRQDQQLLPPDLTAALKLAVQAVQSRVGDDAADAIEAALDRARAGNYA